jgi:glycine/D-amino acid oxidase-like deaminating enzyme
MSTVHQPARDIPVIRTCDICVVGGSCTGVFAAVRAARLGATVALVENNGFFGGVATAGLVNIWHSTLDTAEARPIIGGLTTEILERLQHRGTAHIDRSHPRSDAAELTRAEMEGRRQVRAIRDIVHDTADGGVAVAIGALPACACCSKRKGPLLSSEE